MYEKIIKELEKITCNGNSRYRVFDDFIDAMIWSLIGNEEKYMEVVSRNKQGEFGKRGIDYIAKAFAELMIAGKKNNCEILGQAYMAWNISNKYTGQFFTPNQIASLIASIVGDSSGYITDPACGAGAMLVEKIKQMSGEQLDKSVFVAKDLDDTCVKMCALNMTFFNVNSYVINANTLTDEHYSGFVTIRTPLGGEIREMTQEEINSLNEKIESGQITLL